MRDPIWPYDWAATESRLDPEEIRSDGSFMLSRALNTRGAVAFVGSGASAAYGRASWAAITQDHLEKLCRWLENAAQDAQLSDRRDAMQKLEKKLASESGSSISRNLMIALQLCEQTWSSLEPAKLAQLAIHFQIEHVLDQNRDSHSQPELGRKLFQHTIKEQTHDEIAFIRKVLPSAVVSLLTMKRDDPQPTPERPLPGPWRKLEATPVRSRQYARIFHRDTVVNLLRAFAERFGNDVSEVITRIESGSAVADVYLQPSQYFIVGVLLEALGVATMPALEEYLSTRVTTAKARDQFVSRSRDVLRALDVDLELRRYATTNWDLEIERYFSDIGYSDPQSPSIAGTPEAETARESPLGGRARHIVVGNERSIDLLDFAANESNSVYQVAHLHGRSTDDSDLVITERDYQSAYIRRTKERTIVQESTEVLFGGNPILFVGLGMAEDDLLRPMRQFLSGDLRRNRSLIALVPPSLNRDDCNVWAMEQFSRYGVHVDFFGERNAGKDSERWVYDLKKLQRDIARELRENVPRTVEWAEVGQRWVSLLNELGAPEFESDGVPCDLSLEVSFLRMLAPNEAALVKIIEAKGVHGVDFGLTVERAVSSMVSAALCCKLQRVGQDWRKWWREWGTLPKQRGDAVAFGRRHGDSEEAYSWTGRSSSLWARHAEASGDLIVPDLEDKIESSYGVGLFANTVAKHNSNCGLPSSSRRVFVIASPAGGGKGRFFSELKPVNVAGGAGPDVSAINRLLLNWSDRAQLGYEACFFGNFSFSSEVASVFDALIAFLMSPQSACEPRFAMRNMARSTGLDVRRVGRLGVLRAALDTRRKAAAANAQPLAIVFNAVDLLLDPDGYPKNAEIAEVLHLLLSGEYADIGIDLVLLTRESNIPWLYRNDSVAADVRRVRHPEQAQQHVVMLFNGELLSDGEDQADPPSRKRRVTAERARMDHFTARYGIIFNPADGSGESKTTQPSGHYLHLLVPYNPARPRAVSRFSPILAVDSVGLVDTSARDRVVSALVEAQETLFANVRGNRYLHTIALAGLQNCVRKAASRHAGSGDGPVRAAIEEYVRKCSHDVAPSQRGVDDRAIHFVLQQWFESDASSVVLREYAVLQHELLKHLAVFGTPTESVVFLQCPEIRKSLSTLCMNAECSVEDGFREVRSDLEWRKNLPWPEKHEPFERRRKVIAGKLSGYDQLVKNVVDLRSKEGMLAHMLAEQSVARRAREEAEWLCHVAFALELLVQRGLVFEIDHRYDFRSRGGPDERRYAVHRSVQRFIGRRISAQELGSAETNLFTVSLFASHSKSLPTLSAGAYAFLQDLVENLVEYPGRHDRRIDKLGDRSKCLRTALGVLRSMFTIGVVVRFSELYGLRHPGTTEQGYLERHRLVLRYMLLRAQQLDEGMLSLASVRKDLDAVQGLFGELCESSNDPVAKRLATDGKDERIKDLRRVLVRRRAFVAACALEDIKRASAKPAQTKELVVELESIGVPDRAALDLHLKELSLRLGDVERSAFLVRERRKVGSTRIPTVARAHELKALSARIDSLDQFQPDNWVSTFGLGGESGAAIKFNAEQFRNLAIREGLLQDIVALRREGLDVPPFYRDEIMWLFNECGVFSYAQGHLHDAHALFEQAMKLGRSIEGVHGGHMIHRISINHAFAELDRGHISSGRDLFLRVLHNAPASDVIIRSIAEGGLLCARYLSAQLADVIEPLNSVIVRLADRGRARAAAIFALVRAQAQHMLGVDSSDEFRRSLQLCTQAAAEDITRLCRVQLARLNPAASRLSLSGDKGDVPVNEWLNEAESYAHAMDMPRLLADVMIAKAELQCNIDELDAAAERATRALRVTTLYGMRLKKLECLEIMARINWKREPNEYARRLRMRTLKSARDTGFLLLIQKAEAQELRSRS